MARALGRPFCFVALVLVVAAIDFLRLAHDTGCAGDLKGGALGDPVRALHLDGQAFFPLMAALFALALVPFTVRRMGWRAQPFASLVLCIVGGGGLLYAGSAVEHSGIQSCLIR